MLLRFVLLLWLHAVAYRGILPPRGLLFYVDDLTVPLARLRHPTSTSTAVLHAVALFR